MPQIGRVWKTIDLYNPTSNAHTLTVIHGILKQHAANQNKTKVRKSRIFEEKVGKIDETQKVGKVRSLDSLKTHTMGVMCLPNTIRYCRIKKKRLKIKNDNLTTHQRIF